MSIERPIGRVTVPGGRHQQARIKLVLADDHAMFRDGLCELLQRTGRVEVLASAGDGRRAFDLVRDLKPQVALLNTALPLMNGLEVTRRIVRDVPQSRVILLSGSASVDFAPQALKAGASGLVLKKADAVELLLAIRTVARGELYFSSSISGSILSGYLRMMEATAQEGDGLSDREHEIIQMIAEGYGNQEIARECCISVKTVEAHKANIMKKLSLTTRNELLMYAVRRDVSGRAE